MNRLALSASNAPLLCLLIANISTACITPSSARPLPVDDFPLLAGAKAVPPLPLGEPFNGWIVAGTALVLLGIGLLAGLPSSTSSKA